MKLLIWILLGVPLLINYRLTVAKRVIALPLPIPSHTFLHVKLAQALSKLGHDVWVVIHSEVLSNSAIDTNGLSVIEYSTAYKFTQDIVRPFILDPLFHDTAGAGDYVQTLLQIYDEMLTNSTLFKEMATTVPDFFVLDGEPHCKMFFIFPYRLGVPYAGTEFTHRPLQYRVPFSPAVTPHFFSTFGQHMTFLERMQNLFLHFSWFLHEKRLYFNDAVSRYASEMPYISIDDLAARAEIWLVQRDHILDSPDPTLPNVKMIGGMAASPANPLPPSFQSFMDSASEGVVVVAFGSLVLDMPLSVVNKLLVVFARLSMKIVFRSSITSPDEDKLMTSVWIPQNDLLAHPNTKAFVTHCGMSSQYQALYHAVPMIGVPLFLDQEHNVQRMVQKGFGVRVDMLSASTSDIYQAIVNVTTDPSYKQKIALASAIFREQFGIPAERGAYWLDHVMKYGGAYMRSTGQEIPLYQFLMLDIFAVMAGCVLFSLSVVYVVLRCLLCKISQQKRKTE